MCFSCSFPPIIWSCSSSETAPIEHRPVSDHLHMHQCISKMLFSRKNIEEDMINMMMDWLSP